MTQMLFYRDVMPLQSDLHGDWKLRPTRRFGFAAKTNSLPVTLPEMVEVARELPLVFARVGDAGDYMLAALTGLRQDENLLVDADGLWDGRYVPAFVRRYPFVLTQGEQPELLVCVDRAATTLIGPDVAGERLFADGQPTAVLRAAVDFLDAYRREGVATGRWVRRIADLGLLEPATVDARSGGGARFVLAGMYIVAERRLRELPAAEIQSLFERDDLARIYAHLFSLGNLQRLNERLQARLAASLEITEGGT